MWHRKKTEQWENRWEILKELSEENPVSEDEKTLLLPKDDAEGTRMMWTGATRQYTLHLTDIKNPGRIFKAPIGEGVVIGRKAGEADIVIDYADGDSHLDESALAAAEEETAKAGNTGADAQNGPEPESLSPQPADDPEPVPAGTDYILNTNTGKFHYPDCRSVRQMAEKNKQVYNGSRDEVIGMGYVPCKNCNP